MSKKILIIDDDRFIRQLMYDFLIKEGYEITLAKDGEEGLSLINSTSFDLIITDIIMPEKEGIELIIQVREKYPNLKIIAISGFYKRHYLTSANLLGANAVFTKPIEPVSFLKAVKKLLK